MGVSENALLARARGFLLRGSVLAALTLLMTLLYASTAWAQTFTVTNLNDSGPGSLREAIEAAEANAGVDEIVFADGVSGTITLASTLPTVTDPEGLTIDGGGDVTVSGNNAVRVFVVTLEAKLSLRGLTVSDGNSRRIGGELAAGGALLNQGRTTIINSTITGNSAADRPGSASVGGGIYSDQFSDFGTMLKVIDSTISGNSATLGGGIFMSGGTMEVTNSTISGNNAPDFGSGGGIFFGSGGDATITNSTISGNSAGAAGGGIYNGGAMEVTNSTISGNEALDAHGTEGGGGIYNGSGALEVANSTLSQNSAEEGGGIYNSPFRGATATLHSTIVANTPQGSNCSGAPITDGGYNIDDSGTCGFTPETGSLPDTNPLLDPTGLADNGGPTQTIALLPESPAVDLVSQEACPPPSTDQRGVERPQGEACDSGAFELVQGPQTKADCKQGGWEEFGFKNQGQCIASLQKEQVQTSQ